MTVAGLRYRQKVYDAAPTVTKNGSFIYGGSPEDYHEWEFRTQLRIAAQEQRSRKVRKKKKDESFTTSSKPETGKKERTPKGASSERGSEHGPRSEGSFDGMEGFIHEDADERGRDQDGDSEEVDDGRMETVLKVLEGLRGDAFQKAKDLGIAKLGEKNGLQVLIDEIKRMVFPLGTQEAQALFRSGQDKFGPLARQQIESVVSYVGRRRRWWLLMQQLDPRISLSDSLRAELLLELSGLTRDQQLMIKACAGGIDTFEGYAKIMIEHHGLIHLRSQRILGSQDSWPKGKGKDLGKGTTKGFPKGKGFGKGFGSSSASPGWKAYVPKQAFIATLSDSSDDDEDCLVISDGGQGTSHAMMAYKAGATPKSSAAPRLSPSQVRDLGSQVVPPGGNQRFKFGQHTGLSFEEVTWKYPGYAVWGFKEKKPSLYLAAYLDWVRNYYEIDEDTVEVTRREIPLDRMGPSQASGPSGQGAQVSAPASSSHYTAKKKPPNPPLPVKCRVCKDVSTHGTNAYVTVRTCRDCGHVEKIKKTQPEKKDITQCSHENTSRLGSSRSTMRVFCKDCGNFIDEMPREEAKRRETTGKSIASATSQSFDLVSNIYQDITNETQLSTAQVLRVLDDLRTQVENELVAQDCAGEVPSIKVGTLHAIVQDSVLAAVVEEERPQPPTTTQIPDMPSRARAFPGHSMSAAAGSERRRTTMSDMDEDSLSGYMAVLQDDEVTLTLPEVDLMSSPDTYAVLDEGANSSVAGGVWMRNTEQKLHRLGFEAPWMSSEAKTFNGLDSTTSTLGTRRVPFSILLFDLDRSGKGKTYEGDEPELSGRNLVSGLLDVHVLPESNNAPLLLSQFAQCRLGLVKNMRDFTCTILRDNIEMHVPLARAKVSALV